MAEQAEPLPADWVQYVDESSGHAYFFNQRTGESQWDRPIMRKLRMMNALNALQPKGTRGASSAEIASDSAGASAGESHSTWKNPSVYAPTAGDVAAAAAAENAEAERLEAERIGAQRRAAGGGASSEGQSDRGDGSAPVPVSAASVRSDKSGTSTTSAPATVDSVASSTGISAAGGARLTLGSRVHALFYDGDEWFPGKIVGITAAKKIGGANTYDIMYDTGDREERVPRERVHDSVERAAFLAAKKEEAAWRHGFKRSSWICKRNPAWTEKSPPDVRRYMLGRVCETQSDGKSPYDVDIEWFTLCSGSQDLYRALAPSHPCSRSTELGTDLRIVFVTLFDGSNGIYKLRNILSEELFNAPTQQPTPTDQQEKEAAAAKKSSRGAVSPSEIARRDRAAKRKMKAAAGPCRVVISGFEPEFLNVVVSLAKVQPGCTPKVEEVQDGVIVAVFENREAGQKARAYMSEFGIGEGTLLRCDVYDGEQFIAKTMEAMQNEEATWLFRCVTEAGYLAANVDFKRQNPDWNCHYCGFSNGGILDRCRICNAKSLHAQVRDTGTVDINPDADLKELQARNLTEKEKEALPERSGGSRSTTKGLFNGQTFNDTVNRDDSMDNPEVHPELRTQTMELSEKEQHLEKTFLVQAERARVQKVKKDREVKRKQHQTQQVHGERVFPEGKQNEESPPKHESEALRIARRKSEASRVALEQAESDADRVALLRARRDIALEQKEKGRPGGKRKSEAEMQAEAVAARVVEQQAQRERELAASNLAAQRARLDAMSARDRLAELDREAKLEALVTALEVQEARMLALAERFQAHCVGFQKSVAILEQRVSIEDLQSAVGERRERLSMVVEEVASRERDWKRNHIRLRLQLDRIADERALESTEEQMELVKQAVKENNIEAAADDDVALPPDEL